MCIRDSLYWGISDEKISTHWTHLAGTYDGETVKIYVNGVLKGQDTSPSGDIRSIPSLEVLIGARVGDNFSGIEHPFDGKLDEVRIWDVALDQATIRDWMYRKVTSSHPQWSHLKGYWRFDESSGTSCDDYSQNSNIGTMINMEDADRVTSYAPIGNDTAQSQTDLYAIWSGSTNAITTNGLSMASSVSGDNFAVYGHNNVTGATSADTPSGVEARLSRIWYVDEAGSVTANLTFDLSDGGGGGTPSNPNNYVLLYRTGTSGDFSQVAAPDGIGDSIDGDQITFQDVDLAAGDGYYTLGTLASGTDPVPELPTIALLGVGLAILAGYLWLRRRGKRQQTVVSN